MNRAKLSITKLNNIIKKILKEQYNNDEEYMLRVFWESSSNIRNKTQTNLGDVLRFGHKPEFEYKPIDINKPTHGIDYLGPYTDEERKKYGFGKEMNDPKYVEFLRTKNLSKNDFISRKWIEKSEWEEIINKRKSISSYSFNDINETIFLRKLELFKKDYPDIFMKYFKEFFK